MPEVVSLTLLWLVILSPIGAVLYWNSLTNQTPVRTTKLTNSIIPVVVAFALLLLAALSGEFLLDILDISEPNWRIAAGVLLILGAARLFLLRRPFTADPLHEGGDSPWISDLRMAIWLANPGTLAAAMAFALYRGTVETLVGIAVSLIITLSLVFSGREFEARANRRVLQEVARVLLLGTVLIGLRLIIDGVDGI